jgi:hypothetical protein
MHGSFEDSTSLARSTSSLDWYWLPLCYPLEAWNQGYIKAHEASAGPAKMILQQHHHLVIKTQHGSLLWTVLIEQILCRLLHLFEIF